MASIAYITDKQMIEFHRLNGTTAINFWRPGNLKKFSDFHIGDLLFFLAKGTERGKNKEKGIIGYGKLTHTGSMNFDQMWKKYQTMNGYPNKKTLREAIQKVTKDHQLPLKLTCLELEQVVFFQSPIYLSEIDVYISNHLESYIYLDKEDMHVTTQILEKAAEIGIDLWSSVSLDNEIKKSQFINDAYFNTITNIYNKIKKTYYTKYDEIKIYRFIMNYIETHEDCLMIPDSHTDFIKVIREEYYICIPCIINTIDLLERLQFIIGHYMLYKAYLTSLNEKISILILFNEEIPERIKKLLKNLKISYEIALTNES